MSTLSVLLPPRDTNATAQTWVLPALRFELVDRRGQLVQAGVAPLALLPKASDTVLIVAARDVLLVDAPVPPLFGPRLRQALPNIVEEYLLPDAPPQHLAVSPLRASQRKTTSLRTIASVDRGWLRFVHESFTAAGFSGIRAVPLVACLPLDKTSDTVLLIEGEAPARPAAMAALGELPAEVAGNDAFATTELAIRRHPQLIDGDATAGTAADDDLYRIAGEGLALPTDAVLDTLDVIFPPKPLTETSVVLDEDAVPMSSSDRVIYRLAAAASVHGPAVRSRVVADEPRWEKSAGASEIDQALQAVGFTLHTLEFSAIGAAARACKFDLCQFEFASQPWKIGLGTLQQLRLPIGLLVGSLLVALIGINVEWLQLVHARNATQARMTELLLEAFPRTTTVLDPVTQMRRSLDALRISAGELSPDDFLTLTNGLSASMGKIPPTAIESLDYDRNTLQLTFRHDVPIDSDFKLRLARHGLDAQFDGKRWAIRSSR